MDRKTTVGWDWGEFLWGPLFAPAVFIKEAIRPTGSSAAPPPAIPSATYNDRFLASARARLTAAQSRLATARHTVLGALDPETVAVVSPADTRYLADLRRTSR